ncbi:MAG: protein kinase domain-containing protein [Marinicella sp.]
MTENENNDTNSEEAHWTLLWDSFERIIEADKAQQDDLIAEVKAQHPALFPELAKLIESHSTEVSVLDRQLLEEEYQVDFKLPTSIAGFNILQSLGSGGLGDVYKASKQEDGFERTVAIKFAPAGKYSPLVLDSFNNELKILLSLNHPNIERLFEGGVSEDNIPYLVVEYIDGDHIDDHCDKHKLSIKQRIDLFMQVCQAVATMHQSLIIHRDIKASNIMVDQAGVTKLLDFGLAKLTDNNQQSESSEPTVSGFMMTLAYASPEQIRGLNITTTSDVYSLGMLLYYLLAGQLPYTINSNDLADASAQITGKIPPLASQNINPESRINHIEPHLSHKLKGELDAILAKAISKEPDNRYATAQHLADDLNRHLNNVPILAKTDTVMYRMQKFIQRHTLGVATTTLVILSLAILSVMLFNRSNELQKSLLATQQEKQRVTQVTTFLIDIFKLSDPLKNQSNIVNVKDLLDYSSAQLENQFEQQPSTKAKLYETLGTVYLNMSDIQAAERLLMQAKEMGIEQAPIDELQAILVNAELSQKKGQLNEALSLLKSFEEKHPDITLPAVMQLKVALSKGQLLYQLGDLDDANQLLTAASLTLLDQEAENNQFKGEQLKADINQLLGNVLWKQGRLDQVGNYYQRSYQSNVSRLGKDHHLSLKSLSALGVLAYSQSNYEQARTRFEQVVKSRSEQLGPTHFLTADAHNRLGATHYELGDLAAAESNYNQALTGFDVSGLGASIKYTRVLNNLGLIKRQQKQYQAAQLLFEQALKIQTELLGPQHPDLAAMLNNLGLAAYDQSNFKEANDWFTQAYQVQFAANGLNNVKIAFSMTNIGRMQLHLNQPEKALDWIEKALALRAQHLGTEDLLYAASLMAHAEWGLATKNIEDGLKSSEKALIIRENHLKDDDWRLADSRLITHTLKQKYTIPSDQAWCDVALIEKQFGTHHPRTKAAHQRMHGQLPMKCKTTL